MLRLDTKGLLAGALALTLTLSLAASAEVTEMSGAGATFPYPVYAKWAESYAQSSGVKLNYQSIGSGGGIKQIQARTVAFGASDAPLDPARLDQDGLLQFPMVMGGVVPVVNLPDIPAGSVKLDGALLGDIFMGKVKKWDDPAIKAQNPDLNLPSTGISVVHRSDASGTTWIFTNYLAKVNPAWKEKIGNNTAVSWPTGVGGKGNEGVASYVTRIKGSIGYVEYAYALQNKMKHTKLKNRDGGVVDPDTRSFQAAAASADWAHAPGFYMVLTDQPGAGSWPITGATFILMHKTQEKPEVGQAALKFFDWAYRRGGDMALQLDYVPMPEAVIKLVEERWAADIKDGAGRPLWPAK